MPTVLRIRSFRFFFYSGDRNEPPHVHIEQGSKMCKFWLDPVMYCSSDGFSDSEINLIHKMIEDNKVRLLRSWDEFFNA